MRMELIDAYCEILEMWVKADTTKNNGVGVALTNARQVLVDAMTDREWEECLRRKGL